MKTFIAKHIFHGECAITKLNNFNDYLDFLKTRPYLLENGIEELSNLAHEVKNVAGMFIAYNNYPIYAIDNHADDIKFEVFEDFVELND